MERIQRFRIKRFYQSIHSYINGCYSNFVTFFENVKKRQEKWMTLVVELYTLSFWPDNTITFSGCH